MTKFLVTKTNFNTAKSTSNNDRQHMQKLLPKKI